MNLESRGLLRRWTYSARNCYQRGGVCEGCEIQALNLSGRCVMKEVVLRLIREHGIPEDLVKSPKSVILEEELIG